MSIGFPILAAAGRNARSASRVTLAELRQLESVCLAGVRCQNTGPAGVGQNGDTPPDGNRLMREQRSHVEHFLECVASNDARLTEERLDDGVARRERARVRGRGARTGRGASGFHRHNRLTAADLTRQLAEFPRVSKALRGTAGSRPCRGSSAQYCSRSLLETSALLPMDAKVEKPMLSLVA